MNARASGHRPGFFRATAYWTVGLVALAALYDLLVGRPVGGPGALWAVLHRLSGWTGLALPFAAFAGGLASGRRSPPGPVALRALIVVAGSIVLTTAVRPLAEYEVSAALGLDVSARYPTGPRTPLGLVALKERVERDPPDQYRFWTDRPLEVPPNWLTYLVIAPLGMALFAILSALLGLLTGQLTAGLPPPRRAHARWAIGLIGGLAFLTLTVFASAWVRRDPSHSALLAASAPLLLPLLELLFLVRLLRRRQAALHGFDPGSIS